MVVPRIPLGYGRQPAAVQRRRAALPVTLALVGASLLFGAAGPANAAGELLVSLDGEVWAGSLPHALFADAGSLVPLATHTTTVYLKNSSTSAGFLRLSVRNVTGSASEYAGALSVTTTAPGYPDFPVMVSDARPCRVLIDALRLEAGESVAITSTLHLGNLNGHAGQNERLDLDMIVSLSEAAVLTTPPTQCAADGTTIPVTSSTPHGTFVTATARSENNQLFSAWLPSLAFALGAVAVGILFFALRRRRRAADESEIDASAPGPDEYHFFLNDDES
jgi:hypothetical protein